MADEILDDNLDEIIPEVPPEKRDPGPWGHDRPERAGEAGDRSRAQRYYSNRSQILGEHLLRMDGKYP